MKIFEKIGINIGKLIKMSKNTDNESSKAYALPSGQDDVVATICRIVGEEDTQTPQPMRGMKKTNKVPTAAEQFAAEHHGEYEALGRLSRDRIGRVHRHNQACPKLYDELDKRRSIVAVVMKRREALQLSSSVGRIRRDHKTKRRPRRRSAHRRSRNPKSRTARNRLSKRKKQSGRIISTSRLYRLSKIWKTKGCQTFGHSEFKNDADMTNWTRESMLEQPTPSQSGVSEISKRHPSSEPSVSSYRSFYSTDHEPMVS